MPMSFNDSPWKHLLASGEEGQRLGDTSSLGKYKNVSNQASSGAANMMHKSVPEIPHANSVPSFASHLSKLTHSAQTVQKHHWHQQPGCHPSSGAGGVLGAAARPSTGALAAQRQAPCMRGTAQKKQRRHMRARR